MFETRLWVVLWCWAGGRRAPWEAQDGGGGGGGVITQMTLTVFIIFVLQSGESSEQEKVLNRQATGKL